MIRSPSRELEETATAVDPIFPATVVREFGPKTSNRSRGNARPAPRGRTNRSIAAVVRSVFAWHLSCRVAVPLVGQFLGCVFCRFPLAKQLPVLARWPEIAAMIE